MLNDSGNRTSFDSGAVRDIQPGKGRCDLMPLGTVGMVLNDSTLSHLHDYLELNSLDSILTVIRNTAVAWFGDLPTAMLEVAVLYEEGAHKYGERNWEKGIPAHSFIDSAVRHYLKHIRGDTDERHDRAFIWNLLGLLWTVEYRPECVDLPFGLRGGE